MVIQKKSREESNKIDGIEVAKAIITFAQICCIRLTVIDIKF